MKSVIIPHLDDVGCARGSIIAFDELTRVGLVTSGSVIVPSPLFTEVVALIQRRPDLDVGVHLALTSESKSLRWGPVSEGPHTEELTDEAGYLWPTTAAVRRHASPEAVEVELRAQIETALGAGIAITHIDHHMGAAVAPEFAAATARLATEFRLPVLLPIDVDGYFDALGMVVEDPTPVLAVRDDLDARGLLMADSFRIGYIHQDEPCRQVYQRLMREADPGITFLSLHCSAPGDIEQVHPGSATWRIAEYQLFGDQAFARWVLRQGIEVHGIRPPR